MQLGVKKHYTGRNSLKETASAINDPGIQPRIWSGSLWYPIEYPTPSYQNWLHPWVETLVTVNNTEKIPSS